MLLGLTIFAIAAAPVVAPTLRSSSSLGSSRRRRRDHPAGVVRLRGGPAIADGDARAMGIAVSAFPHEPHRPRSGRWSPGCGAGRRRSLCPRGRDRRLFLIRRLPEAPRSRPPSRRTASTPTDRARRPAPSASCRSRSSGSRRRWACSSTWASSSIAGSSLSTTQAGRLSGRRPRRRRREPAELPVPQVVGAAGRPHRDRDAVVYVPAAVHRRHAAVRAGRLRVLGVRDVVRVARPADDRCIIERLRGDAAFNSSALNLGGVFGPILAGKC